MPKRSNSSTFTCKLNKNYLEALKYRTNEPKKKEPTDAELKEKYNLKPNWAPTYWSDYPYYNRAFWLRQWYEDNDEWEDDDRIESSTQCCGIEELDFQDIVSGIEKNNEETRYIIAKHVQAYNNKDKRVLIVGLPIKKVGRESSQYKFANYKVLRKILLDFGFKQASPKPYKNANSNNMLSVLVGQMP